MLQTATNNPVVDKIIATIGELPASPATVSAVMGLTSNLDTDVEKLGKVLSADQALTAKVLKLSNSSFYGRSKGVGTLKEAILILGFYTLRSLVIASSTHSLYKRKSENQIEQKLWEHSLATAMASRIVGQQIRHKQVEEAFIVGLLHDLGKLILSQKIDDLYGQVYEKVEEEQATFLEVETELLGFNHVDIGFVLLQKWNFPSALIAAINCHHDPVRQTDGEIYSGNPSEIPLAYVTHFCDQLAKHIGCGFDDFREPNLTTLPLAQIAGFDEEKIEFLTERLTEAYQSEKHLFEE